MAGTELFLFDWTGVITFLAWVLFLAVFVVLFKSWILISLYKTYGSAGRRDVWPIHSTIMWVLSAATVFGLGVAIFASVTPNREVASLAAIGVWAALAMGSAISITLTSKGPQELFDRSIGNRKFSMPNRYRPPNEESGGGFAFIVCVDPFDEQDVKLWRESAYVSAKPLNEGLDYFSDIKFWHDNRHGMKRLEPLFGHDQFMFTWPLDYDPSKTASNFYLVRYDGDRLVRLVRCYSKTGNAKCTQYVFSKEQILMIDSEMWALEHWSEVEKNIEALLARWRTDQSPE